MKTKKILTTLAIIILYCATTKAQNLPSTPPKLAINTTNYKTAIGLRAGETSGLTLKHFVGTNSAIEGILGVWSHGLSATVLYEKYATAFNVSGLNWYYGIGGHATFKTGHVIHHKSDRHEHYPNGSMGLGIDGLIGMEYKIPNIPFAVNLDVKPFAEVNTAGGMWISLDPGLGIKVTF